MKKSHWSPYVLVPSLSRVCGPEQAERQVFRRQSLPQLLFTKWSGCLGYLVLSANQHVQRLQTVPPACTSEFDVGIPFLLYQVTKQLLL